MKRVTYGIGGYDPDAPNHNLCEVWDSSDGSYTRYAPDGSVLEQRNLTPAESSVMAAQSAADEQAVQVARAQADVEVLYAQMGALYAQLLSDIASVQSGGWDALGPDQRTEIIVRMLNGFKQVMTGLADHATVTGAITPAN